MKPPCHLPRFLRDLDAGANIVLLVAPAAAALLPELPGALAALAQRGLRAAFPVLPYADIATWVYYRFLREGERGIVC